MKAQVRTSFTARAVGKIDEAHLLRYEQLETIRMLTNHNLDADSPLACLLIGQPTLRRTMKLAVLAALEQRIALRYAMPPMTSQETSSYISHHLKLAGRSDALFSDDAASFIHTTARGYPRAVNNLAIQALVATYAAGKTIVDEQRRPMPPSPKSPTPDRHLTHDHRHHHHQSPAAAPAAGPFRVTTSASRTPPTSASSAPGNSCWRRLAVRRGRAAPGPRPRRAASWGRRRGRRRARHAARACRG